MTESGKNYAQQYQAAIDRLHQIDDESALDQIQTIIDLALRHQDSEAVLRWRCSLIEAASHYGRFDREISAFQDLVRQYEAEPCAPDLRFNVLWYYKWILDAPKHYLDVGCEHIEQLFEKMQSFYQAENEPLSPVYALRYRTAAFMGQCERAEHWFQRWEGCETGASQDCPACQIDCRVQSLLDLERVEDAIVAAKPLIDGEQFCDEVPATTFSRLLLPLLLKGEVEMSYGMMRAVRRRVRHTPKMFSSLSDHLLVLSLVPSPQTARRHASVLLKRLTAATHGFDAFSANRALWVWGRRRGLDGRPLDLPRQVVPSGEHAENDETLIEQWESSARQLAERFDQRHGTDRFSRLIAAAENLIETDLGFIRSD